MKTLSSSTSRPVVVGLTPPERGREPTLGDLWLSARQAAARLGVCPRTVHELVARGLLAGYRPTTRYLRFKRSTVDAYLESTRTDKE